MAANAPLVKDRKGRRDTARKPLNRKRVLEAALAIVDREGLAELTIRRLALELGVEGMSLYKHVADKDAVLDGIVELLWAEVPTPSDPRENWRQALRELGLGVRDVFRRHPLAATLLVSRGFINAAMLRCLAGYLEVLQVAGFERGRALDALYAVGGLAMGYGLTELRCLGPDPDAVGRESQLQRLRRITQILPADLPDELIELAMDLSSNCCDFDRCFDIAINAVLGGLAPSAA